MVDGGALVVFTHAVAIFGVGGVFDRTGPEIVQYDGDSVLSEGSPCISVFDGDGCSALIQRECLVQDPIPAFESGSSTVITQVQKRSSAQPQLSSIFHQLRPIVFGIP